MSREWLKQLRIENFTSQTALALAAGIKAARYSRIESGYSDPRDDEIEGLTKALKLTADEISNWNMDTVKTKPTPAAHTKKTPAVTVVATPVAPMPAAAPPATNPPKETVLTAEAKLGDDLTDPKNFTLMPPTDLLLRKGIEEASLRPQLQQAAAFAEKILHTSKVRAGVWVAWRDFGREAQSFLRSQQAPVVSLNVAKTVVTPQTIVPRQPQVQAVATRTPVVSASRRPKGNKNVFGHFVDIAKETLPPAQIATLTEKAIAAKAQQPELGFMKHFKRLAMEDLPRAEFDRIDREAMRRDGGDPNLGRAS
jgi:DNA-binding XRE family transcriptional regulator